MAADDMWINSLAPGKCAVTLNWWFSNMYKGQIYWAFHVKLSSDKCRNNVNIGSGNGLVPSGNKPLLELMLTQIYVDIWRHWATMS